jgi:hypothetical protein
VTIDPGTAREQAIFRESMDVPALAIDRGRTDDRVRAFDRAVIVRRRFPASLVEPAQGIAPALVTGRGSMVGPAPAIARVMVSSTIADRETGRSRIATTSSRRISTT